MAFLDDISQKLTSLGQTAVQKTKDVTGLAKSTTALNDEERKCSNIFKEIGKLYFQLHADDCEEAFRDYVSMIKDSQQKMEMYRQQIKEARGYVSCPTCGAEVLGSSAFCSVCGKPMPRPVSQNNGAVQCRACGQFIPAGTKFCTSCGTPVSDNNAGMNMPNGSFNGSGINMPNGSFNGSGINMPNNAQYGSSSSSQSQVQNMICKNCGGVLDPNSKFCVLCGTRTDLF